MIVLTGLLVVKWTFKSMLIQIISTFNLLYINADGYTGQGDSNVTYDYDDIDEKFHVYSLVWTKEALTFYVDDKPHHIVGNLQHYLLIGISI